MAVQNIVESVLDRLEQRLRHIFAHLAELTSSDFNVFNYMLKLLE